MLEVKSKTMKTSNSFGSLAAHSKFNQEDVRYLNAQTPIEMNACDLDELCKHVPEYQKLGVIKEGIRNPECVTCGADLSNDLYVTEEGTGVCSCISCIAPDIKVDGKEFAFRYGQV